MKTKCPACQPSTTPGYIVTEDKVKRCEVCKGHGIATDTQIMAWEASL